MQLRHKRRSINNIQLWTFYSVNTVWYLLNLTVLTRAEPYLLSKMFITVYYIVKRYLSVTCVPIYGIMFRLLSIFIRFTLARLEFIVIRLFEVALFWRAFHYYWKSGREGFHGTRIYLKRSFSVNMVWQFLVAWLSSANGRWRKTQTI